MLCLIVFFLELSNEELILPVHMFGFFLPWTFKSIINTTYIYRYNRISGGGREEGESWIAPYTYRSHKLDATVNYCFLVLYFYRGLFSSGAKSCGPKKKKKKKTGAKITISICRKDKKPKREVGVVDSWKI